MPNRYRPTGMPGDKKDSNIRNVPEEIEFRVQIVTLVENQVSVYVNPINASRILV